MSEILQTPEFQEFFEVLSNSYEVHRRLIDQTLSEEQLRNDSSFNKCLIIASILKNEDIISSAIILWLEAAKNFEKLLDDFEVLWNTSQSGLSYQVIFKHDKAKSSNTTV